ncbi:MAG: polyketide cyclase [Bacteroidetes bacterium]|nr:MAG: polyketide cyclase [Bacteroidota bacterium]
MYTTETMLTTAPPDRIWKIWTDVKNWKNWDLGLRESLIRGPFQKNAEGTLIPDKGPKAGFRVTSCVPNFSYTVTTKLPFAELHLHRYLGYHNSKTTVTHEVWLEGPLSQLWWKLIGKRYSKASPEVMKKLKQIAESPE